MKGSALGAPTEEDLDIMVSIAIRRAELQVDIKSPLSLDAWHEVMAYEEQLACITQPNEIAGGVARAGAVMAALAAGRRSDAQRLATEYLSGNTLPVERRQVIEGALAEDAKRLAKHFPSLTSRHRIGWVAELDLWRSRVRATPHVFPCPA